MSEITRYELWQHAGCGHGGRSASLEPMPLGTWMRYEDHEAKVRELEERLDRAEQERDQLLARVGELEEALRGLYCRMVRSRYVSGSIHIYAPDLDRLLEAAQRALERKEEHGRRDE